MLSTPAAYDRDFCPIVGTFLSLMVFRPVITQRTRRTNTYRVAPAHVCVCTRVFQGQQESYDLQDRHSCKTAILTERHPAKALACCPCVDAVGPLSCAVMCCAILAQVRKAESAARPHQTRPAGCTACVTHR